MTYCFGQWTPDPAPGTHVAHGPDTPGTNLEYQTRSEREAFALYSQSVFTINEHFALTLGARWARDQLHGEENVYYANEGGQALLTGGTPGGVLDFVNQLGNVAIPLFPDSVLGGAPGAASAFCNAGTPTNPALIPLYGGCIPSLKNINASIGALNPTTARCSTTTSC